MSTKKSLYHIALNNQGFVLWGTPEKPSRIMRRAPVFGNRFASGDRDYTDFSLWWYWAQTDWFGGAKHTKKWQDDAKYYYSINIDTWSNPGSVQCINSWLLVNDFSRAIYSGAYGAVGNNNLYFIGTTYGETYKSSDKSTWTEFTSTAFSNAGDIIELDIRDNKLWIGTTHGSNVNVVVEYDGSTLTDHTADIITAMTGTDVNRCPTFAFVGGDVYAGVSYLNAGVYERTSLMKYDGANWTEVLTWADNTLIVDMIEYLGDIYYLKGNYGSNFLELRYYDISASTDKLITTFYNSSFSIFYSNYLFVINGKLVITNPLEEIWEYDGNNLIRVYKKDDYKTNTIGGVASVDLSKGGIMHDNKVWYTNLVYDGTYFYNTFSNPTSENDINYFSLFSDGTLLYYVETTTDNTDLYSDNASGYRGTSGKNYLIFNANESVSTIEKLFGICNITFDKFSSSQAIKIYYSVDEMETWTLLGTASYTLDGGSTTKKSFPFPQNTIATKMWLKVELENDGTNTPKLNDISVTYLPIPDYKFEWELSVKCIDKMLLLDNKTLESKTGLELRNLLFNTFLTKESVDFEDIDFASTTLNGNITASDTTITVDSTVDFPERGLIKIDNEWIDYTGKTATTFTGCSRGKRGTEAASHTDGTEVNNKYRVIIKDYAEKVVTSNKPNPDEYIISLKLTEI